MTPQQDGSESNKPTVYPEINILAFFKNREDAVTFAFEARKIFVPEEILPLTTIIIREESGGYSATIVTTDSSDT